MEELIKEPLKMKKSLGGNDEIFVFIIFSHSLLLG